MEWTGPALTQTWINHLVWFHDGFNQGSALGSFTSESSGPQLYLYQQNVCTCESGTGAAGISCPTHGEAKCAGCQNGFELINNECIRPEVKDSATIAFRVDGDVNSWCSSVTDDRRRRRNNRRRRQPMIRCDRTSIATNELFVSVSQGDDMWSLKDYKDSWCSDQTDWVECTKSSIGQKEKFLFERSTDGHHRLRGGNNKWCRNEESQLKCKWDNRDDAHLFVMSDRDE